MKTRIIGMFMMVLVAVVAVTGCNFAGFYKTFEEVVTEIEKTGVKSKFDTIVSNLSGLLEDGEALSKTGFEGLSAKDAVDVENFVKAAMAEIRALKQFKEDVVDKGHKKLVKSAEAEKAKK